MTGNQIYLILNSMRQRVKSVFWEQISVKYALLDFMVVYNGEVQVFACKVYKPGFPRMVSIRIINENHVAQFATYRRDVQNVWR